MKLLFIGRHDPFKMIGGVTEFYYYLPSELKKLSIEAILYSATAVRSIHLNGPFVWENGMKVYYGPPIKPKLFFAKNSLKPLIQLCQRESIDLIHAQDYYPGGYCAHQLKKYYYIPYICTSHGEICPTNFEFIRKSSFRKICNKVLTAANGVTHLSTNMASVSHGLADTRHKDIYIGNGIDVENWQAYLNTEEKNYILGIGRIVPEKGFDVLLKAYADSPLLRKKMALVIAGKGSQLVKLVDMALEFNLEVKTNWDGTSTNCVIFPGYVKHQEKKQLISAAKLIAFPTQPDLWDEAFGIVQLEAMAAGKYLIASDTPATRYLCESKGLQADIVPPKNVQAWRNALERIVLDNPTRLAKGQTNAINVMQSSWTKIAADYAKFYKKVLS